VNVSADGVNFVNAANGTVINFSLTNANGTTSAFVGPNSCTTSGGTGSCTVVISSPTAGSTTIHATTDVTVSGVALHRETNGVGANSGDARKTWVDANIQITPATATNPVGTNHTLTVHVNVNGGSGFVNAPDGTVISASLTNSGGATAAFVGPSGCTTSGGTGSCTVVISSPTVGTTTIHATTAVSVGGVSLTRATGDSHPGDSPDALKTWIVTTIPPCTSLGYPDASNPPRSQAVFNESTVLVSAALYGSGASLHVGVFATDEHALTLGVLPGVTPFPGSIVNGGTSPVGIGNTAAADPFGRPIFPSVFVTDITSNPTSRSGDWQQASDNSGAIGPSQIFGTWKSATMSGSSITPGADPAQNNWSLGTGADPVPNAQSLGYGTEVVWNVSDLGLIPGHAYRLQVMVHDGDQNKTGGDVGESCVNVIVPPGPPPTPDTKVRTDVLDAGGNVVTSANGGALVHDKATVTPTRSTPAGTPAPTGTVVFHRYANASCTGASTDETVPLGGDGTAVSSSFVVAGDLSYQAHYSGDSTYPARDGACEPLLATTPCPGGSFKLSMQPNGDAVIVFDQFPAPNDNSYGVNAVGWGTGGHKFSDLTGSDHSGYMVVNPSGTTVLDFFIDYISQTTVSASAPSGYASLGPFGGDGHVNTGTLTAADLTWDTSLARDLNQLGYFVNGTQTAATLNGTNGTNLLQNSPATQDTTSNYALQTPNPWSGTTTYPENGRTVSGWDFHDTYFVTLKAAKLVAIGAENGTTHQLNPGWTIGPDAAGLHNSPAKPCPPVPPSTRASSVASASATNTTSISSPSFTAKAGKTYLVFAFTASASGDSASASSTLAGSPAFSPVGAGSQFFNGKNYDFAWTVKGGAADSTGTVTVTFAKQSQQAYLQVVELNGNDPTSPVAQSAYANGNNTNPYTANLPAPPGAGNFEVVFLSAGEDLGGSVPVATPTMTNLVYAHNGSGTAGVYVADTASQNTSFAGGNHHWGTIAVEIKHN
jgi:hypothetical protein